MTKEEFVSKIGHEPYDDDLERVNCDKQGQPGHYYCGWCDECDKPRFYCGHSQRKEEP